MKRTTACLLFLVVVTACKSADADVKLPAIFGDHMVVQRGTKIPVWGTAGAGEALTVKAAGQEQTVTADEKGKWRVELASIDAKDPIEISVKGKGEVVIHDVLVGDVWLCSGQSNMEFTLGRAVNAKEALPAADRPRMRLFKVDRRVKQTPQDDLGGKWEMCTPETAKTFSAVGYFFGAALQEKLDQPIGLIEADWGGTRAEAWLPRPVFDALKLPYEPQWTERWLHPKQDPKAKKPEPSRPHEGPAVLFNGMIAPLAGYAMRGAVWYQGETNTAYPKDYADVLGAMIKGWRAAWNQGDFPFLVVQLPNFLGETRDWATLRASQARVAREVPKVGMAVTIDLGEPHNIHPTAKQPVGHRLALVAERLAYGMDVQDSGPTFSAWNARDGKSVIRFDHVYGGLVAKGGEVLGFEVAGEDGKFVVAKARIEGETVVLEADGVASPKHVRYAWANDPKCTLYNAAELPSEPFSSEEATTPAK